MLRKKTFTYALISATAVAGIWVADKQMPFWTGAKKDYSIEMVFLKHDSTEEALQLFVHIDKEKAEGHPIKVMFTEAADENRSNYERDVRYTNDKLVQIGKAYKALIAEGYPPSQAESECLSGMSGIDQFNKVVCLQAAIRDIKVLPLESHSDEECKNVAIYYSYNSEMNSKWSNLVARNAPLKDLMQHQLELASGLEKLGLVSLRNQEVATNLSKRFEEAVKLFPELRLERLKGNQIRAIGWMGLQHRPIEQLVDYSDPKVEFSTTEYIDKFSISAGVLGAISRDRPFTEREAYLLAIDQRYVKDNIGQIIREDPEAAEKLVQNALKLNLPDLRLLDTESSGIANREDRGIFILNGLIGTNYFKKPN
jgi:hypothetical protein